jgi:hypothetical protein
MSSNEIPRGRHAERRVGEGVTPSWDGIERCESLDEETLRMLRGLSRSTFCTVSQPFDSLSLSFAFSSCHSFQCLRNSIRIRSLYLLLHSWGGNDEHVSRTYLSPCNLRTRVAEWEPQSVHVSQEPSKNFGLIFSYVFDKPTKA